MDFKLCVPCLLGLEAPIADELKRLGMANVASENGRVYFTGDESAIACANINLRVGERVLVELGRFNAVTFEELFQGVKAIRWEDIIPRDGAFPVKGYSLNSALFSVSDCQKIIKKAIVERLRGVYGIDWFPESAETYQVQFSIMKDNVSVCLDTSGEGLHKRGYRPAHNAAPLKETMAAAMVKPSCSEDQPPTRESVSKARGPHTKMVCLASGFRGSAPSFFSRVMASRAAWRFTFWFSSLPTKETA